MSYIATGALQVRLREVLEDGLGSLRTITAGTYGGNLPEGMDPSHEAVRALGEPQVEALITNQRRSPNSPPTYSNLALMQFDCRVKVTRRLGAVEQLDGAARDVVKAAASTDADVISQALGFPGNLLTTSGGTPTGLVSGLLSWVESRVEPISTDENGTAIVRTEHMFTGTLTSAPATS